MKWRRDSALGLIILGSASMAQLADLYGTLTQVEDLELVTLDRRQQAASRQLRRAEGQTEVVIVFFDEEATKDWSYLSPFSRPHLADLVNAVSFAGAKTIGLDVYLDRRWDELNRMDGGGDRLRQALADAGNVILVSMVVDSEDGESKVLANPDPYFAEVAAGVASADLPTPFETIRDGTLTIRSGEGLAPGFALALYAHSRGFDVDAMMSEAKATGRLALPGLPPSLGGIPKDWWLPGATPKGYAITFPLRFSGPPSHLVQGEIDVGTFKAIASQRAVELADIYPDFFRDKIVLLGTGFHDSDKFRTPYHDLPYSVVAEGDQSFPPDALFDYMYGVEIHAQTLQNFIDEEYLRPLGAGASLALLLILGLAAGGVVFWKGAVWGGAVTLALGLGTYGGAFTAYLSGIGSVEPYLWIPIVVPLVALGLSYLGSTAYVSIVEGREKRFIRSAFGKYVSPTVVGLISENPDALKLGGEEGPHHGALLGPGRLHGHVRANGRGRIDRPSERLPLRDDRPGPRRGGHARQVYRRRHHGVLERADPSSRSRGPSAPMRNPHAAEDGRSEQAVDRRRPRGGDDGGTHRAQHGRSGGRKRGWQRPLRLQRFRVRVLDFVTVKGKIEPVTVYEVLEMAGVALSPEKEEAIAHYEAGMKVYRGRDWELAREYFKAGLDADPSDGPSKVYLERSKENIANPPPADWDFVVRRTTK